MFPCFGKVRKTIAHLEVPFYISLVKITVLAWLNISEKGVFCHSCLSETDLNLLTRQTNIKTGFCAVRDRHVYTRRQMTACSFSASRSETVIVHNNVRKRNHNKEVSKRWRRWKRETARLMSTEGEADVWMIEFCHYCIWSCLISNNDSRCLDIRKIYLLFAVCQ